MKRLIFVIVFLFCKKILLQAQSIEPGYKYKIGITGGFAFYDEKDLEMLNSEVQKNLPFTVEAINNFPPYYSYGAYILAPIGSRLNIGPVYHFYTTGSRLGAKDYSASYSFDQIISAHSLGIQTEITFVRTGKLEVGFENIVGVHFARWSVEEKFSTREQEDNDEQRLTAIKPFAFPGIKFSYPIIKGLGIAAKAGYSFDLGGKFRLEDNKAVSKSEKNASFTGLRLHVALEYKL